MECSFYIIKTYWRGIMIFQTINWLDYFSIGYIVFLLICLLIGMKKGLVSGLFTLIGVVASIVLAAYLAKPLGEWLYGFGWGDSLSSSIYQTLLDKDANFGAILSNSQVEQNMDALLSATGMPSFLFPMLSSLVLSFVPETATEAVGVYIANGVTNIVFIAASFIVLFILFAIAFAVLKHFFKGSIKKHKFIKSIDMVLGAVFGLAIGAIVLCGVSYAIVMIVALNNDVSTWFINTMSLDDPNVTTFAKWLYEQNFVQLILDSMF